jgi:hypothetical protein
VGHSTVNYVVKETCKAIWTQLVPEVMAPPNENKWIEVVCSYYHKWNFPNCIGSLDGKHVRIQAPSHSGSLYFNYKGTHSIVLLALVDANLRFLLVDVGGSGRNSDGGLFANSNIGKALQQGSLNIPNGAPLPSSPPGSPSLPFVLIADEAFPLRPNIMRPFSGRGLPERKRIFNYRLSRARRCVESAFGILAARWRLFMRVIAATPSSVEYFVKACTVLHNFLGVQDDLLDGMENDIRPVWTDLRLTFTRNSSRDAQRIRDTFADYFNSREGQLPWQSDVVNRGL